MEAAYEIPQFDGTRAHASDVDAELIAVPLFEDDDGSAAALLNGATSGEFERARGRGELTGKPCQLWTTANAFGQRRLLIAGAGPRARFDAHGARRFGASVAIAARSHKLARVGIIWPEDVAALVESVVEGVVTGNYDPGHYKSKHEGRFFVAHVTLATPSDVSDAIARGIRVGEAVNAARVLINEPGNRLTPRQFAERGQALLALPDVRSEILDERQLEQLGMRLLLGVGRGSVEPPRLLVARYEPPGAPPEPLLALVGKGITFDTGGISIKPADNMELMKGDMAGGATVIAALRAIASERVPVKVLALVPTAENMPSGTATKPGDVHTSASGLTVEINNTDAEGRLILGDALWYARQQGATHLIDVATLTGACIVALGKITTGLFATDGWSEVVQAAARRAGEKVWRMPIYDEYRESLKSEIADLLNSPGRAGGAITAAMFLKEFAGDLPWAHLDIAGTAWAEDTRPWNAKGATGVMIRTLVEVARSPGTHWP
jgi:leucyl aminopeptidase